MKTVKVIKIDTGRVTIQVNSFDYPELKVRSNGETTIIGCDYEDVKTIEKVVMTLLESKIIEGENNAKTN